MVKKIPGEQLLTVIKLKTMFATLRSSVFIDALHFQISSPKGFSLRGVLKDDSGRVCRSIEKDIREEKETITMENLNELPYGRYTLELSQGEDEIKLNLVKRV